MLNNLSDILSLTIEGFCDIKVLNSLISSNFDSVSTLCVSCMPLKISSMVSVSLYFKSHFDPMYSWMQIHLEV